MRYIDLLESQRPEELDAALHLIQDGDMHQACRKLIDLLDTRYEGDHAAEFDPYMVQLIVYLLHLLDDGVHYYLRAVVAILHNLGVKWSELDQIRDQSFEDLPVN